jgi:CRP/FNR family cyclic AMP-dependent transcriptional regulator
MVGAEFLCNVSLFAHLTESELRPLAQRLVSRRYSAGEEILSQGSTGSSLYIVKSGLVEIVVTDPQGNQHPVAHFGPGQAFGEFALLDGLPRSAGAIARERSELLILMRPEFFIFLEQNPKVAINLLVLLSRRLRFALQRIDEPEPESPLAHLANLLVKLVERYGEPLGGEVELPIRLTLGELAGMMGQPRSVTQQALDSLIRDGLVNMHGQRLLVPDLDGLRKVASEMS